MYAQIRVHECTEVSSSPIGKRPLLKRADFSRSVC